MDIFSGHELRQIPLSVSSALRRRNQLLEECGLSPEDADFAVGVYDAQDSLLATASLCGDTIKGVCVRPEARDLSLTAPMATALLSEASARGITNVRVFTKPEYEDVFRSLAFSPIGRGDGAVLLESDTQALKRYLKRIASAKNSASGKSGCIVMNVNPLTLGHFYLLQEAASQVDTLYVIPVGDDTHTFFSLSERVEALVSAATRIGNVCVLPSGPYCISRSTFPSYFIKELNTLTRAYCTLDLDIFASHIAPALDISVRFAGSEPLDALTAAYNDAMREILPPRGIEVRILDRLQMDGEPISASRVRAFTEAGRAGRALQLVPRESYPMVLAAAAFRALVDEVDTTPKPGLVDRDNSGAHTDMDHSLMLRSASTLRPWFTRIASVALTTPGELRQIGIEAEADMMRATSGVNTHRGALFSMGLAVAAASRLLNDGKLTLQSLRSEIQSLASGFPRAEGTHGASVATKYGVPTALDSARQGFLQAFEAAASSLSPHEMLLSIMATLPDTNIYHRCGKAAADDVKQQASSLLANYSDKAMRDLDRDFTARGISPGGAADMLALALFIKSILNIT